jgi:hypothetical protein
VGNYPREVGFPLFCWLDADTVIHGVKSFSMLKDFAKFPTTYQTPFVYSLSPDDSALID